MVRDTENFFTVYHTAVRLCPHGQLADYAQRISGFHVEQLADSVQNSADVICSHD